jgi:hypothetical protein
VLRFRVKIRHRMDNTKVVVLRAELDLEIELMDFSIVTVRNKVFTSPSIGKGLHAQTT